MSTWDTPGNLGGRTDNTQLPEAPGLTPGGGLGGVGPGGPPPPAQPQLPSDRIGGRIGQVDTSYASRGRALPPPGVNVRYAPGVSKNAVDRLNKDAKEWLDGLTLPPGTQYSDIDPAAKRVVQSMASRYGLTLKWDSAELQLPRGLAHHLEVTPTHSGCCRSRQRPNGPAPASPSGDTLRPSLIRV